MWELERDVGAIDVLRRLIHAPSAAARDKIYFSIGRIGRKGDRPLVQDRLAAESNDEVRVTLLKAVAKIEARAFGT